MAATNKRSLHVVLLLLLLGVVGELSSTVVADFDGPAGFGRGPFGRGCRFGGCRGGGLGGGGGF
ncbi:unnamed protein product, partial [Musa hybrid cultivar]